MTDPVVSAAVLAGGESRRFGVDKALVSVPDETTPMLAAVVDAVREVAQDVTIIAPENRAYARFGVPVVSEAIPGQGPLGGLEMALQRAAHERCIVVACDLPYLNPDLLRWMCQLDAAEDAVVPVVPVGSGLGPGGVIARPQVLHAIYRRSCLQPVRQLLENGERRLGRLLDVVAVRYLSDEQIRAIDPALRSFVNLNTIAEWEEHRQADGA